jgi:hypothetical protein
MGFQIEDGTGDGYQAKVNSKNMLNTNAITQSVKYYINRQGNFYSCTVTVTASGAGDCFFYLKNTDDPDLIIQRLSVHAASNEVIKGYLNDSGTPVGGTNYVPINRNGGSANLCDCDAQYGVNITGMSGGHNFDNFHIAADNHTHTYRWEAGVMVPKNRIFTLYVENGAVELDFTLTFFCCLGI